MWLRKYIKIFSTTFKESMAYRFDTITSAVFSFVKIYLAFLLWQAIFEGKTVIGSYTLPMMLTYYIVITFLRRIAKSEQIIWETSEEVRTGSYTKYITRPLKHFSYALARSVGKGAFSMAVDLVAFGVWIVLFRDYFVVPNSIMDGFLTLVFAAIGLLTMMQLHYLIALISFKTIDIAGPYFLINNFIEFMAGGFIPLMILPKAIEKVLSYTPFYYVLYYPVSIYLGTEGLNLEKGFTVIILWNLILFGLRKFLYQKMINLYEGVGA